MNKLTYIFICFSLFGLGACSNSKYLNSTEVLYTGADLKIDKEKSAIGDIRSEIENVIVPEPNTAVFGFLRIKLWIYNKAGEPKKNKGIRHYFRNKIGEKPVLLRDVDANRTSALIENRLYNNGFFFPNISFELNVNEKKKKATVTYEVKLGPQYIINKVTYPDSTNDLGLILKRAQTESLIDSGNPYNLDLLKEERTRLNELLKNDGYYYFNEDFLLWEIDSTLNEKVNVYLKVKEDITSKYLQIYRFNEIYINPQFDLSDSASYTNFDTLRVDSVYYLEKDSVFRPEIIVDVIDLEKGGRYTSELHDRTIRKFTGLGPFKFVNVKFEENEQDSLKLDAYINLTPLPKKSLKLEFSLKSKSNNFAGPGFNASFRNRNLLRGAELLTVNFLAGFESQIAKNSKGLNSYEIGGDIELELPRFIVPFNLASSNVKYPPKTLFKIDYRLLSRIQYYKMSSVGAKYGYKWREAITKSHELYPITFNYVQLLDTKSEFDSILNANPLLRKSFEQQFIFGTSYSYTFDSRLAGEKKNNFYFNIGIELAGNSLRAGARLFNPVNNPKDKQYEIFGRPFSQFVRTDITAKYHFKLGEHQKIVSRITGGVGVPFGNSTTLPYIKQFYIGGSNSIRAFQARTLGPGTYNIDKAQQRNTLFLDQAGDLKMEANLEYRFDIISFLKGAFFADAGNIWLLNSDTSKPGGKFNAKDFYKEFAVGTGAGLRVDASFFVIRLDWSFPIRKPYFPDGKRWVFDEVKFGDKNWRQDNFVYSLAIGYPF